MEKRSVILTISILIAFFFFATFVSARISVSDVNSVYNFGDKLSINVDLTPSNVYGNFEINLNCDNQSVNIYKVPAESSFSPNTQQKVSTYIILEKDAIQDLSGNCFISSSIGSEQTQTKYFIITDSVLTTAKFDKQSYNPGETITFTLNATKANGIPLEGFLEASGASNFSNAVTKGQLVTTFSMPETTAAGVYTLNIQVYDKGKNNSILNQGEAAASFSINQVPTLIQTSLDKTEVEPGTNLTVGADLFDQSGKQMPGIISVTITSPEAQETQISVNSGEFGYFSFPYNITSGNWKLYSSFSNVSDEKDFTVNKIQKVSFDFIDSVLVVTNIGNSRYNNTLNISIGNTTQSFQVLNLPVGEQRKFTLKAPDGEYDIQVGDQSSNAQKKMLLTGDAVSIKDMAGIGIFSKYPFIWAFMLIIMGCFALVFTFKFFRSKTSKYDSAYETKALTPVKRISEVKESNNKSFIEMSSRVNGAESSLVLQGQRSNATIISLKLHNASQLKEQARQEIEKMLAKARVKKGVVEFKDDYIIILFTPLITRISANEWIASKVAYELMRDLVEYNKKAANKIDFGIGVNSGDIAASVEFGKLKYTSMGGTVLLAKKISDFNRGKVFISEDTRKKILKDLKVQRVDMPNNKVAYEILGISDREANQGKLDDLLKRMKY
jgi:tellurite resistance protein